MKTTMTCQCCGKGPATLAPATGQLPSYMMAEGKMGEVWRWLCDKCAQGEPQNAKTPISA
jgi:hypothetical protein